MSLRDWKLDTWLSYKNANKSQRSSAFLHNNKELNKEKMLILKLPYFCLALLLQPASITFEFPLMKLKSVRSPFFFLLPEVPLFSVKKVNKTTKISSRRKPGFLVAQGLAPFWALPTRSAALGAAVEVASRGGDEVFISRLANGPFWAFFCAGASVEENWCVPACRLFLADGWY